MKCTFHTEPAGACVSSLKVLPWQDAHLSAQVLLDILEHRGPLAVKDERWIGSDFDVAANRLAD
jgi:hypothetical protein